MVVLYFSEFTLELLKRAEAFMLVTLRFTKIDNALLFCLPADDPYRDSAVVSELPVNFSHSSRPCSFIVANASTIPAARW